MIFFLLISSLLAQTYQGKLLEKGTKKPLADINIYLLPEKIKSTTNKKGEFVFPQINQETSTIIISVPDYQRFEKSFSPEKLPPVIYLEKEFYDVYESVVVGKVLKRDDTKKQMGQESFAGSAGTFGGDPIRAAQNFSGVNQSSSAQIVIQGAAPGDTAYTIDGHQIPIIFHFGGLSSVLPPLAVESVEFLPAGYGSEYSRAIGGLIGLKTKKPNTDRWSGYGQIDIFNMGALAQGPIDENSSLLIGARYSYVGKVLEKVAEQNEDFNLTAAPTFADVNSTYFKKLTDKTQFKMASIISKDELNLVFNKAVNDDPKLRGNFYQRTEFFRFIPQLNYRLNEKHEIDYSLGFGKDAIFFDINNQFLNVNSWALTQRGEWRFEPSSWHHFSLGLDHRYFWYVTKVNLPSVSNEGGVNTPFSVGEMKRATFDGKDAELGFYLKDEIKLNQKLFFIPQLRLDYFTQTQEPILQPRVALRYIINDSLYLRSSGGLYTQAPEPQQYVRAFGNPFIDAPRSNHYTIGFEKDFRRGSQYGLTWGGGLFYKELDRLIVASSALRSQGSSFVPRNFDNLGDGTIRGLESTLKFQKDPWTLGFVYTYLESTRRSPGQGSYPSEFDQTHNLNFTGSYRQKRWTYSTRIRYVTGNPYTPIQSSYFDGDSGVYTPVRGDFFSQRLPAFFSIDIRIDRRWIYNEWILSGYLDIQNLTNSSNPQNITFSYDYEKKEYVNGFPILPTFGVKGEF